jgi:hypothetical protein
MEAEDIQKRDLEFLCNLVKTGMSHDQPRETAMGILWSIAVQEKQGYARELMEPSRKYLLDLVERSSS